MLHKILCFLGFHGRLYTLVSKDIVSLDEPYELYLTGEKHTYHECIECLPSHPFYAANLRYYSVAYRWRFWRKKCVESDVPIEMRET
jgi:hypothetical protein